MGQYSDAMTSYERIMSEKPSVKAGKCYYVIVCLCLSVCLFVCKCLSVCLWCVHVGLGGIYVMKVFSRY